MRIEDGDSQFRIAVLFCMPVGGTQERSLATYKVLAGRFTHGSEDSGRLLEKAAAVSNRLDLNS